MSETAQSRRPLGPDDCSGQDDGVLLRGILAAVGHPFSVGTGRPRKGEKGSNVHPGMRSFEPC